MVDYEPPPSRIMLFKLITIIFYFRMSRESEPSRVSFVSSNRGAMQLCVDGFLFTKNKSRNAKTYWECLRRKHKKDSSWSMCPAKATTCSTSDENATQVLICASEHNHAPIAEQYAVKTARAEMKYAAINTRNKPCQIIQAQQAGSGSVSISVAPAMPTKSALRKMIGRARCVGLPKEPRSLNEIEIPEELRSSIAGKMFFQKSIDVGDDKILIFTTEDELRDLERCEYWMADGTFKTAPSLFMQLFTIHGCVGGVNGQVVPLVYVLMTRRTIECYAQVLENLVEIAEGFDIELNPKVVLTDFERAEMNAFKIIFKNVESKACIFHLGQSIYRRIASYGLARRYSNDTDFAVLLRQLFALAYLPEDEIEAAFFQIQPQYPDEAKELLDWFQTTYVVGKKRRRSQATRTEALYPPKLWSVYSSVLDNIPRTQNIVESWHNRWRHLVGFSPGVYSLVGHFRQEQNKVRCDSQRAIAGQKKIQSKEQMSRDEKLRYVVADRANRTAQEYLKGLAYNLYF